MQDEIRGSDASQFLQKQRFIDFKEKGELSPPTVVADKLWQIIENPQKFAQNLISLRDL